MGSLSGQTVAILEARRSDEMVRLIERQGGTAYVAPALREVAAEDAGGVAGWTTALIADEFAVVVFLTGVGCKAILDAAQRQDRLPAVLAALGRAKVAVRGPKPVHVLKQHGVRIDLIAPEPNTSDELLASLGVLNLRGTVVGVQMYGGQTAYVQRLLDGLAEAGAEVHLVSPYRWERPLDEEPLRALITACQSGRIGALLILSSSQIHNLFAVAEEQDQVAELTAALNAPGMRIGAVGPVAADAVRAHGLHVDVQPEHPKMGPLVLALAEAYQAAESGSREGVA